MEKFVPYEKLSKRRRREIDKARRATWEGISPVTRKKESAVVYNRKKRRREEMDSGCGAFFV
ncbi:MAG: hypothetical protein J6K32_11765 [Clostridia bacterium]|nr:hypothetical protein [Clostridia bacterium]